MHSKYGRSSGFTTVELATVCTILLVVSGVVTLGLGSVLQAYRTGADARMIASQISQARMRASATFTRVRLLPDTVNRTYQVEVMTDKIAGTYQLEGGTASLSQGVTFGFGGVSTPAGEQTFHAVSLGQATPAADRAAIAAFHLRTAELQRAATGTNATLGEAENRLGLLRRAIEATPGAPAALAERGRAVAGRLRDLRMELRGDSALEAAQEPTPPTLLDRVQRVVGNTWSTTQAPTATHRRNYEIASQELAAFLPRLQGVLDELRKLETDAEAAGAPWTPGRLPVWKP